MTRIPRTYIRNRRAERRKPVIYTILLLCVCIGCYIVYNVLSSLFSFERSQIESNVLTTQMPSLVQVELNEGVWNTGVSDIKLYENNRVKTLTTQAVLTMFDSSIVTVDQNSEIHIIASSSSETSAKWQIELVRGSVSIATSDDILTKRSIVLANSVIDIPKSSLSVISQTMIANVKDASAGIIITPPDDAESFTVGEGQMYTIPDTGFYGTAEQNYEIRTSISANILKEPLFAQLIGIQSSSEETQELLTITNTSTTTTSNTVTLTGKAHSTITTVQINDNTVPVVNGEFSYNVALNEGENIIQITATTTVGETVDKELRITRENAAIATPRILSPVFTNGIYVTNEPSIVIRGETSNETVAIIVNDYTLQLYEAGSTEWRYLAQEVLGNLQQGKNVLTIVARNASGVKSAPLTVTIDYSPTNPTPQAQSSSLSTSVSTSSASSISSASSKSSTSGPFTLSISGPSSTGTFSTSNAEILLEGKNSTNIASVSVNGYTLQLFEPAKGFWNYKASASLGTMTAGKNTYTVIGKDSNGTEVARQTFIIEYSPVAPTNLTGSTLE